MITGKKLITVLVTLFLLANLGLSVIGVEFDSETKAKQHFEAIAEEDGVLAIEGISTAPAPYLEDAYLSWVGGDLAGSYYGGEIGEVWSKFYTAHKVKSYKIIEGSEKYLPKFASASVVFTVMSEATESKIPVTFVLTFSDEGTIEVEKWTIDQSLLEEE